MQLRSRGDQGRKEGGGTEDGIEGDIVDCTKGVSNIFACCIVDAVDGIQSMEVDGVQAGRASAS